MKKVLGYIVVVLKEDLELEYYKTQDVQTWKRNHPFAHIIDIEPNYSNREYYHEHFQD